MSLPPILQNLELPVVCAPMFIVSGPELVIAQCKAGVVGSFPALNARPAERRNIRRQTRTKKSLRLRSTKFATRQIIACNTIWKSA